MVTPTAGSIVLVRFPFSDLSQSKLRPAVVVADAGRGDWVLCQITSSSSSDARAVELTDSDFQSGSLRVTSYARPAKLFTASNDLMTSQVGTLKSESFNQIVDAIIDLMRSGLSKS